jgi:Outer membrane protein beta-barrel domain
MKQLSIVATLLLATTMGFSQTDTLKKSETVDTIKAGNFIIIKKNKETGTTEIEKSSKTGKKEISISINTNNNTAKKSNISTNWWIFDLGFANYRDQTNYSTVQGLGYVRQIGPGGAVNANSATLITGKSSNANLWFFMQRLNITKHKLNLKYGLGLEMYNFRYDRNISFRKDPNPYMFNDSISFSKNKLYAGYLTIPLMLNFNATPNKKNGFTISAGVSAGYLIASRNKQISAERGKVKYKGDLGLEPWRFAAIGELGIGPVRLYGSYSLNTLHKKSTGLVQYPYTVGVRFSRW